MPLRVEQHPCWVATCDGCEEGDNSEHGGSFHYFTEHEAHHALEGQNWTLTADGRWLCWDCADAEEHATPKGGPS